METHRTLHRPVEELEAIVVRAEDDPVTLESVYEELESPATPRARDLRQRAGEMLERARAAEQKRGRFGLRKRGRKASSLASLSAPRVKPEPDPDEVALHAYRMRLLDLGNEHPLLNFRHCERDPSHVRLIDHPPDVLMAALRGGQPVPIQGLPPADTGPDDEDGDDFALAMAELRASDPGYLKEAARLDSEGASADDEWRLECELRDRARESLGLPPPSSARVKSLTAHAEALGLAPGYELPTSEGGDEDGRPEVVDSLQTLVFPDMLAAKLSAMKAAAATATQTHGIHTLFAAFGFLEWRESERAYRKLLAPLLLLPVRIDRLHTDGGPVDVVADIGEPARVNPVLRDRLAHDFGITLPPFGADDPPEAYLERVRETVCQDRGRWKVRRFVTLGLFDAGPHALFHDLDPANWPAMHPPHTRPAVKALLQDGASAPRAEGEAEPGTRPGLVADADAAQFDAVRRACTGESLVVMGAPGTGKSRTVVNLIAAGMAAGRRVLLLGERTAALDTVKARLDRLGLGRFAATLYGDRAPADNPPAEAGEAPGEDDVAELRREVDSLERRLGANAGVLAGNYGSLGKTVAEILWDEIRTRGQRDLPPAVERTDLAGVLEVTADDMARAKALLRTVEDYSHTFIADFGAIGDHPWQGVHKASMSESETERLRTLVAAWEAALTRLAAVAEALPGGIAATPDLAALRGFARAVETLPPADQVGDAACFAALHDAAAETAAETLHRDLTQHGERLRDLAADTAEPLALDGHADDLDAAAEEAGRLGVGDTATPDLPGVASDLREQAGQWRRMVSAARELMRLAGLPGDPTPARVTPLLGAATTLRAADARTLRLRLPSLADPEVQAEIDRGQKTQKHLRARVQQMETAFRIPADDPDEPAKLRAHAAALRQERILMELRPSVRRAKRRYKSLVLEKGAHKNVERARMAGSLESLAELVQDLHDFRRDKVLCRILGDRFAGVDTDFEGLSDATAFVCAAIETYPGEDAAPRAARKLLIEAKDRTLAEVIELAGNPDVERLSAALDGLSDYPDARLADYIDKLETRASDIEALSERLTDFAIRAHVRPCDLPGTAERVRACEDVRARIDDNATAREALGPAFLGVRTDADMLAAALDAARRVKRAGLPEIQVAHLFDAAYADRLDGFRDAGESIRDDAARLDEAVAEIGAMNCLDVRSFAAANPETAPFAEVIGRLRRAGEHGDALSAWSDYLQVLQDTRDIGAGGVLDAYAADGRPFENLETAYERQLFRTLSARIFEAYPDLRETRGRQADMQRRYREGLARLQEMEAAHLRAVLAERFGGAAPEPSALPCVMACPRRLAEAMPPSAADFDLVIVTDAGRMRPEVAMGALARGRQAVIVGDATAPASTIRTHGKRERQPSLLDLARRRGWPGVTLAVPDRGRDPGLAAFASRNFHDNALTIFFRPDEAVQPSPFASRMIVTGCYLAGVNVQEAQDVAETAVAMLKADATRSLGVVALTDAQADVIRDCLDRLTAGDTEAAARIADVRDRGDGPEAFFVKSIAEVQGDMRDVILVSTTYGLDVETGRLTGLVGPVTETDGARDMAGLVGAARSELRLVTSMHSSDLDAPGVGGGGLDKLRQLLAVAAEPAPIRPVTAPSEDTAGSAARILRNALETRGYLVDANIGMSGYHLDLAVRDPGQPETWLLGIEIDSARYTTAPAVRDSDAAHPAAMERHGWSLVRIWSTEWHADFEAELASLESRLHELVNASRGTTEERSRVA